MNTAQVETSVKTEATPLKALPAPANASHRRSRWWVWAILLVIVVAFGWLVSHLLADAKAGASAEADKRKTPHDLPVVIATAARGDMEQYLIGLGTVTPLNTVTVKSRVDGAIMKVNFMEGQMVKAGDFLLQIDSRPYDAALKQAQGQLARDKATKDSADWNVQQDTIALKDHGISEQQLRTDTAARDNAAGAMEVDQAAIDSANLNLTYAHITAPISGRIGLRLVDEGNIVHASDTTGLAVITQLQPIAVVFNLPEDNIDQIQKQIARGQPMVVDAYDRDLTEKLATGTVLAIDNQIDPTTGTVKIKAQFDNKDGALYPSQFVNARLLVNTVRNAVIVPSAGIQHSPTSTFAYVVTPDPVDPAAPATRPTRGAGIRGTVSLRDVSVGPTQAAVGSDGIDTTVILSGLEPGEIIVTDGVDKLQNGSKIIGRTMPAPVRHSATRPTTMEATTQPAHQHRRRNAAAE